MVLSERPGKQVGSVRECKLVQLSSGDLQGVSEEDRLKEPLVMNVTLHTQLGAAGASSPSAGLLHGE